MRLFRFWKPAYVPDAVFRDYVHHSWNSLVRTFDQVLLGLPGGPLIRHVQAVPILNASGRDDDEISKRTIEQSNVENVVLPGGHLMLLEHLNEISQVVERFLTSESRNPAGPGTSLNPMKPRRWSRPDNF